MGKSGKKKPQGRPEQLLAPSVAKALHEVDAACKSQYWDSPSDEVLLEAAALLETCVGDLRKAQRTDDEAVVTEDRSSDRSALLEWAVSKGATAHEAVRLEACRNCGIDSENGTRVATTSLLPPGELIFAIPEDVMLRAAGDDDVVGEFIRSTLEAASPTVALALRVAHEKMKGAKSEWAVYLKALPLTFEVALTWPTVAMAVLTGRTLRRACSSRRAAAKAYCEVLRAAQSSPALAAALPAASFNWALWEWSMCAVVTRQNAVPDGRPGDHPPKLALVPLWDMCNHERHAATTEFVVRTGTKSGFLEMRSSSGVEQGGEVFMDYGERSNAEFVLHSGFFDDSKNPHDRLEVCVPFDEQRDPKLDALLATLLEGAGVAYTPKGWRGLIRVDRPEQGLYSALLAASADKPQAAHLMRRAHANLAWTPADDEHHSKAVLRLAALCTAELEARPCGDESSSEVSPQVDLARRLADCERRILQACLEFTSEQHSS